MWLNLDESTANWQWFLRADHQCDAGALFVVEDVRDGVVACALGGPQLEEPAYPGLAGSAPTAHRS
jgi:hypothetical protein